MPWGPSLAREGEQPLKPMPPGRCQPCVGREGPAPAQRRRCKNPLAGPARPMLGRGRAKQLLRPCRQAGCGPGAPSLASPLCVVAMGPHHPYIQNGCPGGGRSSGLGRLFSAAVGIETPFPINLLQHTHTFLKQIILLFFSFFLNLYFSFFPFLFFPFFLACDNEESGET